MYFYLFCIMQVLVSDIMIFQQFVWQHWLDHLQITKTLVFYTKEYSSIVFSNCRTVWFRYTLFSICTFPNLHGFRSAQISICTDFDLQSRTFSSLHGFRSAQFLLCNFWICKDFALLSIRSAQISICTDFDLHVFRYANQF